jgi:BolA family transcriptional regulator, general stress-responsive regulator
MRPELDDIRARFDAAFPGASIELSDDSHLHAGHAGSAGGAGHYTVRIVSDRFEGRPTLARHRLVYDAVKDWMPHRIHALVILARSPAEAAAQL